MKKLYKYFEGLFDADDSLDDVVDDVNYLSWMSELGCTHNRDGSHTPKSRILLIDRRALKTAPKQIKDMNIYGNVLFKNVNVDNIRNFCATNTKLLNSTLDNTNIYSSSIVCRDFTLANSVIKNSNIELQKMWYFNLYNSKFENCTFKVTDPNVIVKFNIRLDMPLDEALEYVKNNINNKSDIKLLEDMGIKLDDYPGLIDLQILCKDIKRYIWCLVSEKSANITTQRSDAHINNIRSLFK